MGAGEEIAQRAGMKLNNLIDSNLLSLLGTPTGLRGANITSLDALEASRSRDDRGRSPFLDRYEAVDVARRARRRPDPSKIAESAKKLVAEEAKDYAFDAAPKSEISELSGNRRPGKTRIEWLAGWNKCNQFVAEALHRAGAKVPFNTMKNGSKHVLEAERWPEARGLFDRVKNAKDLRPGDVLVFDYPGRGESSAHLEVVTEVGPNGKRAGAHANGAEIRDLENLAELEQDPQTGAWKRGEDRIYVLRPKRVR